MRAVDVFVMACGHCGVAEHIPPEAELDATVVWHPRLCTEDIPILRRLAGQGRSALFLVEHDLDLQARLFEDSVQAGIHPLRVRFLDAWHFARDPSTVAAYIRAAVARVRAQHDVDTAATLATTRFRGLIPRRSLFDLRPRFREPLPELEVGRCIADRGCDLCVRACPQVAIQRGIPPRIDPTKCISCGLCRPACPEAAIGHPQFDFRGIEAEAGALLDRDPVGLLVVCRAALWRVRAEDLKPNPADWRLLEVPCIGMLRPMEVLRLYRMGFSRVVGLRESDGCTHGEDPFRTLAGVLEGLGFPGLIWSCTLQPESLPSMEPGPPRKDRIVLPPADSLPELVAAFPDAPTIAVSGRGAGLPVLDSGCTACGLCAARCWSRALTLESSGDTVRLLLDHGACDGCGLCQDVCPEGVLVVRSVIDPAQLGRTSVLVEDVWVVCPSCGQRVAPQSMVDRVAATLQRSEDLTLCPDCRSRRLLAVSSGPRSRAQPPR